MEITWLGWAGVEIEHDGERVVVDPLEDPAAVFAALGDRAAGMPVPEIVEPRSGSDRGPGHPPPPRPRRRGRPGRGARLRRPGATSRAGYGGEGLEQLAVAQADHELTAAGLNRNPTAAWASAEAGPFTLTAIPAVDGTGDPQVSWLIEAGGRRVLHLRRHDLPRLVVAHRRALRRARRGAGSDQRRPPHLPAPRAGEPAAGNARPRAGRARGRAARARERLIPIHYGGYDMAGLYEPVANPVERVRAASDRVLEPAARRDGRAPSPASSRPRSAPTCGSRGGARSRAPCAARAGLRSLEAALRPARR